MSNPSGDSEIKVSIAMELPIEIEEDLDEGGYIVSCAPLGLATQGDTQAEASQAIRDAIVSFFESCIARGTLEEALKELGWQPDADFQPAGAAAQREGFRQKATVNFSLPPSVSVEWARALGRSRSVVSVA